MSIRPPIERSRRSTDELYIRLASSVGEVRASLEPKTLEVILEAQMPGLSPTRVDPLWHRPVSQPRLKIVLTNDAETPKILTLRNTTLDIRFQARYARWIYEPRPIEDSEGSVGVMAKDGIRADGSLRLLLRPGETRTVQVEFRVSLDTGVESTRLLNSIDVEIEDCEDTIQLRSLVLLRHPEPVLLEMLPSIYREGVTDMREALVPPETPFFERYLVGCNDAIEPLRKALSVLDALFGAFSTPPDYLLWLATWVCVPLDENWPEMKRRKLISKAVELFRWRGTAKGLSMYLEVYAGVTPVIHDQPQPGVELGSGAIMGDAKTVIGDIPPHTFTVSIAHPMPEAIDERIVRRIIDYAKPAHTSYRLVIVRREFLADELLSVPSASDEEK